MGLLPLLIVGAPGAVGAQGGGQNGAGLQEACTEGRISSVEIQNGSLFDTSSTASPFLRFAYEMGNLAHVRTREDFIRDEMLLSEGDCFDPLLLLDSRIVLERHPFLRQVSVESEDDGLGGTRISVETWDEWSLRVDLGITYDEGVNFEKFRVAERNFLGRGVVADINYESHRDREDWALRFSMPRLIGRAEGALSLGRARRGYFADQRIAHPFVGETGRVSVREVYSSSERDFVFSTDGTEPFSHVLVPVRRDMLELGAARRFGEPDRSTIVGVTLRVERVEFPDGVGVATGGDLDNPSDPIGALPTEIAGQMRRRGNAQLALHLGRRGYGYREYTGLDALRDVQTVELGAFAGITVGQAFGWLDSAGGPSESDPFVRVHASFSAPLGASLVVGGTTVEARRNAGWKDVFSEADVAFYARSGWLANQTLFGRISLAGGWEIEVPYQLTLGGRDGVRSLLEFEYPGGRQLILTLEDRVVMPWPDWDGADFGLTAFGDVGRVWQGGVPYGVDSGWKGGVGVGLRVGAPSGTRNAYRSDLIFPIGPGAGGPIFRFNIEVNRLRDGFFTPELRRSRQFDRGPEHF